MKWEEYIEQSARTDTAASREEAWDNYSLGLFGEVGEVTEIIKKHLYHGAALDLHRLQEEFGDVCWYLAALARRQGVSVRGHVFEGDLLKMARGLAIAVGGLLWAQHLYATAPLEQVMSAVRSLCSLLDLDFEEVLDANIAKLRERYPDGFVKRGSDLGGLAAREAVDMALEAGCPFVPEVAE